MPIPFREKVRRKLEANAAKQKALTEQAEKLGATVNSDDEEDETEFIATFRD